MFIIGLGFKTIKNYGRIKLGFCSQCRTNSEMEIIKVTLWISFFFIPIIPYSKRYLMLCSQCRSIEELDKQTFESYVATILSDKNNEDEETLLYKNKTETQINYLKEMAAYQKALDDREEQENQTK